MEHLALAHVGRSILLSPLRGLRVAVTWPQPNATWHAPLEDVPDKILKALQGVLHVGRRLCDLGAPESQQNACGKASKRHETQAFGRRPSGGHRGRRRPRGVRVARGGGRGAGGDGRGRAADVLVGLLEGMEGHHVVCLAAAPARPVVASTRLRQRLGTWAIKATVFGQSAYEINPFKIILMYLLSISCPSINIPSIHPSIHPSIYLSI